MNWTSLAHAGEEHGDTASALAHAVPWYLALPAFLTAVIVIGYAAWFLSKKNLGIVLIVECGFLLATGFLTYAISPIVAILSITGGLLISAFLVFADITAPDK